jgi:2-C-methyl-D-erythritol 4-phosphate cytidylyltransferase
VSPCPVVALILAGGTGSRMGRPKQFLDLGGMPALLRSMLAFELAPEVDCIYAVGDLERVEDLAAAGGIAKYAGCGEPGKFRSLSTKNGLRMMEEYDDALVLVHDGSRCLVTPELIGRVVAASEGVDGVIPALPVSDTIKRVEGDVVVQTLDRSRLCAVQTPQAFRLGALRGIYAARDEELLVATDDASLLERAGGVVRVVEGERTNIKLTTPEDLIFAEAILRAREGAETRR